MSFSVAFWWFDIADRFPRGIVRFVWIVFALIFLSLPSVLLGGPLIAVATAVEIWEEANK